MKRLLTNGATIRWTLLTMLGLGAGVVAALLLDRPIEALVGMILITPVLTLLAGAILGTGQWLHLRSLLQHASLWVVSTCIGLGVGLTAGVVTVEKVGGLLLGHRLNVIQVNTFGRALSFVVLGSITGLAIGIAQWVFVLRHRITFSRWITISGVSLGVAFALSSVIVDSIMGGIARPLGVVTFVLLAGFIFGAGTARPLLQATPGRT